MKWQPQLLYTIIIVSLLSCGREPELEKSVFQPDPEIPELPAYSEWGYNTFGALYDREVFVNTEVVPAKIIVNNDTTTFLLQGRKGSIGNEVSVQLSFRFPGFAPSGYTGLIALHDTIIDLQTESIPVSISIEDVEQTLTILNGTLTINRVQNLLVDSEQTQVILSGLFNFQATLQNEEWITISDGRFDVGIGETNFFQQ